MTKEIKYEEVKRDFRVDEEGRLFRLSDQWGRERELIIKRNTTEGYCSIRWKGGAYKAHRLLYSLYHQTDVDTTLVIDHINNDRLDNSKANLRLVTQRDNCQNHDCHKGGKLLGAKLHKNGRWEAYITINDKFISLGRYDTEIEASKAYLKACTMSDKTIEEIQKQFNIKTKDKCSSKYQGVCYHKASKKWQANSTINSNRKYLGLFTSEEEACQAILAFNNNPS